MTSVSNNGNSQSPNLAGKDPIAVARHRQGFIEMIRSDAYVNLSTVAVTFPGKRVSNWTRGKQAQALFEAFKQDPAYGGAEPVKTIESRESGRFAGSELWAHPDIAIQFAQWCSPAFALWVSRQIRHLLEHGEVNLHYTEWTEKQRQQGHTLNRDDIRELYG